LRLPTINYIFFSKRPERVWGPHSLLFSGFRGSCLGVKRPSREVNHSLTSSAEVTNYWSYTSIPPYMPLWLGWGKLFLYHYLDNNVFRNIITTIILIFIIIIISSVKRGKWNHLKIIQQCTGKARNQGTTENSHIGHCTQTAESADVKVLSYQHGK